MKTFKVTEEKLFNDNGSGRRSTRGAENLMYLEENTAALKESGIKRTNTSLDGDSLE